MDETEGASSSSTGGVDGGALDAAAVLLTMRRRTRPRPPTTTPLSLHARANDKPLNQGTNFEGTAYVCDNDFVSNDFLKAILCEDRVNFSNTCMAQRFSPQYERACQTITN